MVHDQMDELRDELLRCLLDHKKPDIAKGIRSPGDQGETNKNSADGVPIPSYTPTDSIHHLSKCVDNNAVAVIDEEDVHSGVTAENISSRCIMSPWRRLNGLTSAWKGVDRGMLPIGDTHNDNRYNMQLFRFLHTSSLRFARFNLIALQSSTNVEMQYIQEVEEQQWS
jgi:hypothetical protein